MNNVSNMPVDAKRVGARRKLTLKKKLIQLFVTPFLFCEQGRFVVSTKEFSKGEWVSEVAEPYSYCVNDEFKRQACGYCLKLNDDDYWTWCEECQTVFYCSERCRDRHREEKHPFECNVLRVLRRNIEWSLEDMFTSKVRLYNHYIGIRHCLFDTWWLPTAG
jgi:hypothetical protein